MSGGPDRPRDPRLAHRAFWWPYLVIAVLCALLVSTHTAQGGFSATVGNAGDQARTGSLLTAATSGATTECDLATPAYSPIVGANTAPCSGNLTPSLATGTGTSTLNTTITDKGGLPATAASLSAGACGPIQLADSVATTDPMLVRGSTLSFAQTGPLTGGTALGLSGTSGFAADVTSVSPPTAGFSEAIWFKTATAGSTTGGTLMGFASTPSNNSNVTWDRMVWLDNTGRVVFGVRNTGAFEATTTAKYNDGNWHLAVATVSSITGMSLYVDAAAAATNNNKAAQTATGYWHVGWDSVTSGGWSNAPTNAYFAGSLADAAIIPSALTATQVNSLYTSGTQATWASRLAGFSPTHSWTLGDTGTTAYTGTVPSVTPAACSFVDLTVGATTTATSCAYPSSATACPAPSTASRLSSLASTTSPFGVAPTTTQTMTITATVQRDTINTVTLNPYAAGLHLSLPLTVTCIANTAGTFSANLTWPGQDLLL